MGKHYQVAYKERCLLCERYYVHSHGSKLRCKRCRMEQKIRAKVIVGDIPPELGKVMRRGESGGFF